VIIEVALNGQTRRERNPTVPLSRQEIIDEGLRCLEAGASILHNHNQNLAVSAEEAAAEYGAVFDAWLARDPNALCLPTLGHGGTTAEKLRHVELLARAGRVRLGFIDPGSLILGWADASGRPDPRSFVYVNTFADIELAIEQCRKNRLGLHLALFEPGFLRNVIAYHRLGEIPRGSFVKFYFGGEGGYMASGPGVSFGLQPTRIGLDAYLELMELGGCRLPWFTAVVGGDYFATPIPRLTLERGGHLRVGLEDFYGARKPSNTELVEQAVALAREVGRPVATPKQAAEILGLPPLAAR
jgi:hypothetical protein